MIDHKLAMLKRKKAQQMLRLFVRREVRLWRAV